jgi:hypothetical protein
MLLDLFRKSRPFSIYVAVACFIGTLRRGYHVETRRGIESMSFLISGKFKRGFLPSGKELTPAWFAVSYRHVEGQEERRKWYGHWCRIGGEKGTVYRVIRFAPNLPGDKETIVLDWQACIDLAGKSGQEGEEMELSIRPASLLGRLIATVKHPDPTHRLMGWVSIISVGLAVFSIVISLWQTSR